MIVVCKRGTKRLIKGYRYEVANLWNSGTGGWRNGKLMLVGINSRFSVNSFTDSDGNPIGNIDYTSNTQPVSHTRFSFDECSKGDILVCNSERYKTFVKDGMYKIEELITKNTTRTRYNGTAYTHSENFVKFVGIKRKIKFNSWSFRKLNANEAREISLNHILNNEDTNIIVSSKKRNIELVEDKDDVLLKTLAKSILDPARHHLSIIEWACEKQGDKLALESSDYESYMNMTLTELLSKIK